MRRFGRPSFSEKNYEMQWLIENLVQAFGTDNLDAEMLM